MSYSEDFLKTSQAYTDLCGTEHLSQKLKTRVAIVTCTDSRLYMTQASGLAPGGAHILWSAGGHVTDDIIRSLVISQQQLGTCEIVVLRHAGCGAQSFTNEASAAQLERNSGVDIHDKDFSLFSDVGKNVCKDIAILWNSPLIPGDVVISGAVYNMGAGCMREIKWG